MTNVKEQAVELINRMSDEKVMAVIAFVKNMIDKTDSSSDIEKDVPRSADLPVLLPIVLFHWKNKKKSIRH